MMVFDFEGNPLHGFYVVPSADQLTTASLYGPDIDAQIASLKAELDTIANKMKAELRKPKGSLFEG